MAAYMEGASREVILAGEDHEDLLKPSSGLKPHLTPKPFSLQRNTTIRSILAPKTVKTAPQQVVDVSLPYAISATKSSVPPKLNLNDESKVSEAGTRSTEKPADTGDLNPSSTTPVQEESTPTSNQHPPKIRTTFSNLEKRIPEKEKPVGLLEPQNPSLCPAGFVSSSSAELPDDNFKINLTDLLDQKELGRTQSKAESQPGTNISIAVTEVQSKEENERARGPTVFPVTHDSDVSASSMDTQEADLKPLWGRRNRLPVKLRSKFEYPENSQPQKGKGDPCVKEREVSAGQLALFEPVKNPMSSAPRACEEQGGGIITQKDAGWEETKGGSNIKQRISFLFDSCSRPEGLTKKDEPQVLGQSNRCGDVKQRIKVWAAEATPTESLENTPPRLNTPMFRMMDSFPEENSTKEVSAKLPDAEHLPEKVLASATGVTQLLKQFQQLRPGDVPADDMPLEMAGEKKVKREIEMTANPNSKSSDTALKSIIVLPSFDRKTALRHSVRFALDVQEFGSPPDSPGLESDVEVEDLSESDHPEDGEARGSKLKPLNERGGLQKNLKYHNEMKKAEEKEVIELQEQIRGQVNQNEKLREEEDRKLQSKLEAHSNRQEESKQQMENLKQEQEKERTLKVEREKKIEDERQKQEEEERLALQRERQRDDEKREDGDSVRQLEIEKERVQVREKRKEDERKIDREKQTELKIERESVTNSQEKETERLREEEKKREDQEKINEQGEVWLKEKDFEWDKKKTEEERQREMENERGREKQEKIENITLKTLEKKQQQDIQNKGERWKNIDMEKLGENELKHQIEEENESVRREEVGEEMLRERDTLTEVERQTELKLKEVVKDGLKEEKRVKEKQMEMEKRLSETEQEIVREQQMEEDHRQMVNMIKEDVVMKQEEDQEQCEKAQELLQLDMEQRLREEKKILTGEEREKEKLRDVQNECLNVSGHEPYVNPKTHQLSKPEAHLTSPDPKSREETNSEPQIEVFYDDFSVSRPQVEVVYEDFSAKPKRWGSKAKAPLPNSHIKLSSPGVEILKPDVKAPSQPFSSETAPTEEDVDEEIQRFEVPYQEENSDQLELHESLFCSDGTEQEEMYEDANEQEAKEKTDKPKERLTFCPEQGDTEVLFGAEIGQSDGGCDSTSALDSSPKPIFTEGPLLTPDDTDNSPFIQDPDLLLFPETTGSLLDNRAQKSKVQLGKRRSVRVRPPRLANQSSLTSHTESPAQDWRACDTAEGNMVSPTIGNSEDLRGKETSQTTPTLQRVPLFAGLDPSALIAQLKKRGGVKGDIDDKDGVAEVAAPTPSQLPRSPRSPFLPGATRVLPPIGIKATEGPNSSPSWLKELKSRKRLSQHDSEV